LKKIGFEKLG